MTSTSGISAALARQRGIFSEVINPENASSLGGEIFQGPSDNLVIQVNRKQNIPKARSIGKNHHFTRRDMKIPEHLIEDPENIKFKEDTDIITVDPKVIEPYEPIPGRVPRKVAINRKKKEYASFVIEELLLHLGIDNNKRHPHVDWLPLELFDDTTFDDYEKKDWIKKFKDEKINYHALTGKGLYKHDGLGYIWRPIQITDYTEEGDKFTGHWLDSHSDEGSVQITRINFVLDAEDPRKFAQRVANAHQQRVYADSLIRYNYYIDNMPTNDLNDLDTEQKKRLEALAKTKKLEGMETTSLLMEVNNDYARTMNKIIFEKFLLENEQEMENPEYFPVKLTLPPDRDEEKEVRYFGMVELERTKGAKELIAESGKDVVYKEPKDFTEIFKDFCFASLYIKEEVIKALQLIRVECNKINEMEIFNFKELPETMRIEEFKHIQDSSTSQILYHLKGTWVRELINIIRNEFSGVGKGWFNMKETSKITYDFGKLKKFLTVVRLMMQDTLLSLIKRCYFDYFDFIASFVPKEVKINERIPKEVVNIYDESSGKPARKKPLFTIDLLKTMNDEDFLYSTNPQNFVSTVLVIFDKALEEMAKIPDLEQQILKDLYRSQKNENYIKAPMKPRERPITPENSERGKRVQDENKWVWDLCEALREKLEKAIEPLGEYLKSFQDFKKVLQMKPDQESRNLEMEDNPREVEALRDLIIQTREQEKKLREAIPESIHVSFFNIQCKDLLEYLQDKYQSYVKNIIDIIANRARNDTRTIFHKIEEMKNKVKEQPKDIDKLTEIKEYINDKLPVEIEKVKQDIKRNVEIFGILEDFSYRFSSEDMNRRWTVFGGPKETLELVEQRRNVLEKEKVKFLEIMKVQQDEFKQTIDNLERTIQNFHHHQNLKDHENIAKDVESINEQLMKYVEDSRKFNQQEGLFEMETTDYNKISQMIREFTPYSNLWLTANNWYKNKVLWKNGEWDKLDAESAERFVEDGLRTLSGVIRFFTDRDMGSVLKIAEVVRSQIEKFRPKVPLMVALRKKGMKERHWNEVREALLKKTPEAEREAVPKLPTEDFTFKKALKLNLMSCVDVCVDVGERASKEYQIETMLKEMHEVWEKINFQLLSYKGGTYIIRGYDDIQQILDEHIVNTMTMQFSPHKKHFEEEIIKWNSELKIMSDILEEWAKCQSQWMYLQPIFDSQDIAKQLPNETKKFKTVDSTWKHTMGQAFALKNVHQVCTTEGLLERLQEANKNLEVIQKELNNYLEKKREKFARFYFLSNDDLLEILSQTKEPTAVQPHLRKVFENINSIEFDSNKRIQAMFSAENERIKFVKHVDPTANKGVEDWMGEVEDMMKKSVRAELLKAVQEYPTPTRTQWVISHPGQCVLNGSQITWTMEVEEAIRSKGIEGLREYFAKMEIQLNDLVELVRTKLTKQQMVTLNALIVIDVHAKDVVEKLVNNNVENVTAFEWISQLRYYWETDDCFVKCIQTNFPYGYEYLGNTLRLVITPLTDKCYMTLMGALRLNLGGAPAGPAGTGKTETTKDLAKALAKQCVVFNCSDSMDYIMVGKFFKGLASAGAWCCFDEFNRINIEVLSVIAQQLSVLFSQKDSGAPRIEFEGSEISINPTFSVFITMNPGYAGRTELPDNLKALFRAVAMMVPDYALIGEIMFYSFGFKKGRELARKMVATFKLSSEQLSSQDHYDYGMRAVRSVINAAGLLKAATPDMNEDQLLLRALRDVNVPKFLKDDLPLFENIILDLFPGIEKPKYDYGDLLKAMEDKSRELKLQPVKPFVDKVIQLYDTIQVRHGLMIVGPTGGGKTCNYNVLAKAISSLAGKENFSKVHTHILNPKSIKMGQLYGEFNEQTHEWTDGILAAMVREYVKDLTGDKHWVIFDGPVDALWIESMNTVLDDNKKLCLNSGQILTLTPYMTMMFEVEDLLVASPATVSRCGMVYMEPVSLGFKPLIASWMEALPENLKAKKTIVNTLNKMFTDFIEPALEFLRKSCKELVTTSNNNLVQSLMRILTCYLIDYKEDDFKKISPDEIEQLENMIEPLFIFATVWSIGCTGDLDSRKKFDLFLRALIVEKRLKFQVPDSGMVHDYFWGKEQKSFVNWSEKFANFQVDSKLQYHEIDIPTNDSTRNIFLIKMLITNKFHVLCPGPTGTGKSQNIYNLLTTKLSEEYQYIALTFSAQTSANQTQDTIDSKMEKRRKGYYGPPVGKRCVIFVDDLNMPKKETFGAQPPIELVRQFFDHKGWYNRKDLSYIILEDIIVLSAMGPPGGGRTFITPRCIRHFNILTYTELDEQTIVQIFSSLTQFFLKKFSENIREQIPTLISSVLHIYNTIRTEMLPTPSKSHYTFNLRDIWKVFQGICSVSLRYTTEISQLVRLFYHENMRVFHDRLTTEEDRDYLKNLLVSQFSNFKVTREDVFKINKEEGPEIERILFGDFQQGREAEPRHYYQITDLQLLLNKMETFQDDFNSDTQFSGGSKKSLKLVMFLDACEHIARIARIIRQPQGNALLLGVGGSGRQSLARMATFISNYKLFQIEVAKNYNMRTWRDDLKKVLMMAGIENKPVTFLFVDTQIINEQMLEDINNILNSGDVTGVYNEKDMEDINSACKHECIRKNLQPNPLNVFTQYLLRIRKNIHCVIAMSPLGEVFTTRLRMFPSLVNCCTIDWFTEWPEEALVGVGKGALIDVEQELGIEGLLPQLVDMFKAIHKSVERMSIRYKNELRRYNYVTPTSYLELLMLFKSILGEKRHDLKTQLERLRGGLERLNAANIAVEDMRKTLKEMQPELEKASIETEKMMEHLKVDKDKAEIQQKQVSKDEAEATRQQAEATEIARQAEQAVAEANITLEKTLIEVQKLRKEHLVEIKSFTAPAEVVKLVCQAVVILNIDWITGKGGSIITKNVQGAIGKKEEDYFETAKKYLLNEPQELLNQLIYYDKNSIKASQVAKVEQGCFINPNFNLESARHSSYAVQFLFAWVKAMIDYFKVYTETKPLREKLGVMQKIVEEKTQELKVKKEALDEINEKIMELERLFSEKVAEKDRLSKDIMQCEIKLDRAQKLTEGLSDEKENWTRDIQTLSQRFDYIPGDSVVSAGMVSYAGAFTSFYRQELEKSWLKYLDDIGLKRTPEMTMVKFLGESVKIQQWNIAGLPKDDSSIENGIIIDKARRWPLMIDPQTQANKFIKNMGKEHTESIDVVKQSDQNLSRTIELAIQFGKWVLLENVGKELDPALEPILLQQVIRTSSSASIVIGDKTIPYNDHFKFFMTTTLPNPHYSPETSVKVTIINFAITPSGLEEQMLATIVGLENQVLEQKKIEIVKKNAQDKKDLLNIQDSILKSLSESKADISELLMDETLINKLSSSKKFAAEINQRVKDSKVTEIQIDKARESYRPVAYRASLLFFCIMDLANVDPMYQYSLQWFTNLFVMGVEHAAPSANLETRLENLNSYFTYSLYENVCRSLFEKHKLIFSLLLTVKILQGDKNINEIEWKYLLTGPTADIKVPPNPTNWIADNTWPAIYKQIHGMNGLEAFAGFEDHFMRAPDDFKDMYESANPEQIPPAKPWDEKLDDLEKLIVLKTLRSDKLIPGVQNWISSKMGKQFIIFPTPELGKVYKDSSITTPIIIVLSPGSDPKADFVKLAKELNMANRYDSISLGQGQGEKAEKMIKENCNSKGGWVLLQNCHLAISWMPELEKLVDELSENMNKDFRLWLTSMPDKDFPMSVLQNGVKMTIEPPQGLRNNLLRTYNNLDDKELEDCKKPDQFKKLLFGFCLFHAIIQDRRKFGPIGWNIAYEFTNEDLTVCKRQLKMLLDEYEEIPYKVINFLGAEINYGGRVTDDKDERLIKTILKIYITPSALADKYNYSESGIYYSPPASVQADYIKYISELPLNPSPEAFGLHDNAEITNAQNETMALLETILSVQPRDSAGAGRSREDIIEDIANFVQERTPPIFDISEIQKNYPTEYTESMNTVLVQEIYRYNRLLEVMQSSLVNVKKALRGKIVMSDELEKLANSLNDNQVPKMWDDRGFLSMKPLASWTEDLNKRISFLTEWINKGTPKVFWISGFFFPQAFLTGTMQNYARSHKVAIDRLTFKFKYLDTTTHSEIDAKPEDGCYVWGLFLEGARWDYKSHRIASSKPKELYVDLPLIHLLPTVDREPPKEGIYKCPLYKVVSRRGTLSTTGHSTNFVMFQEIPTKVNEDVWIRAGVASFLALRY